MKVTIIQNNTKTMDMDRNIISNETTEYFFVVPETDMWIKDNLTGKIIKTGTAITTMKHLKQLEDIEIPKEN